MSKNSQNVRKLVLMAILTALVIVLQVIGGIPIGPVSITLTLVPIVVGAILLGPAYGAALGLVFGLIVSILSLTGKDPGGQMVFAANPFMAWAMCLVKGVAAGFFPALIYKLFNDKKFAPHVLVALSGVFLFVGGAAVGRLTKGMGAWKTVLIVFLLSLVAAGYLLIVRFALKGENAAFYLASMIAPVANTGIFIVGMLVFFRPLLESWAGGKDTLVYVITGIAGINFIIEFAVSVILAPAIALIVRKGGKAFAK